MVNMMAKNHRAIIVLTALTASLVTKDLMADPSTWPEIIPPKPLGNEDTGKGKRKSGKRRYEPPKFG